MTSDFKPGKAYLIEGKRPEEVKHGVKEWFQKYEFEILDEKENEIQGYLLNRWARYDVWLYIKFKSLKSGTLLIFHNKIMKHNEGFVICFPDLKRYVAEWQKNLVRFLLGKKEFGLGYFTKLFNLMYILSIFIFIFLIYDPSGQFPEVLPYPILFGMALILLLLRFLLSMYKLRQANLPEFKVEEYRERLELIEEAHL